jgi:DNA repair and recombination RAD54-like protein
VVCPSSLVTNWANEFNKWLGKASQPKRVVINQGGAEGLTQMKSFFTPKPFSQVLILSYDLLRLNAKLFSEIKKVGLLVVDEGHRLKNSAGSLTLTALESLDCDARLLITATPIQNVISDFFNIANFVCPGLLGDLATFRRGKLPSTMSTHTYILLLCGWKILNVCLVLVPPAIEAFYRLRSPSSSPFSEL